MMGMQRAFKKSLVIVMIAALCFSLFATLSTTEVQAASKTHLKKESLTMTTGATYQQRLLTASNSTISSSKVTWRSNNSKVAKVSKTGKVTAVKQGTTTLKAKYKGKTYSFKVKVKDCDFDYLYGAVCVVGGEMQMYMSSVGGTVDASKIKWESSNKKVLTVNSKGVVKGVSVGTATVYGTYLKHRYSRKITVELATLEDISTSQPYPDKRLVYFNYTTNYPNGINVELGKGSELVQVFHKNQGTGNRRYASVYCYPNVTGSVEIKVYNVSEPDAYYLFYLNFRNGAFEGLSNTPSNNSSGVKPPTYDEVGAPDFGGLLSISPVYEEVLDKDTVGYIYDIKSNSINTMAICATYRDFLTEKYGWRLFVVEDISGGGMAYGFSRGNYMLVMEWIPKGSRSQIGILISRNN